MLILHNSCTDFYVFFWLAQPDLWGSAVRHTDLIVSVCAALGSRCPRRPAVQRSQCAVARG